jgi:hypothetical protein
MAMLRIRNSEQALNYLKGQLSEGMALARLALREVDFEKGEMYVWMPLTADQDAIENFKVSRRLSGDEDPEFCRFAWTFIQDPNCAVILQDTITWNTEGERYEALAAKYGDELYWYIAGADLSEVDVLRITGMAILPYPWVGVFYTDAPKVRKRELTENDLQEMVKSLVGIAVTAFDNCSYVLWWNTSSPLPISDVQD